jgi:hypothetical protein
MIQLEPDDVERLARVTERLGEGSDASTIRRLIRQADAEESVAVAKVIAKVAQRVMMPSAVLVNKPAGIGVEVQLGPTRPVPGSRLEKVRKKR